ncbi:MAG: AzlC family ABC transporter permease [Oscillospiraceae bacterium]|nr:AzlC family ABC transporter permease [Oscillospiraceae bacterium]
MKRKALRAALPHTIPVFTGYLVLGISYGVLITAKGAPFWMPMLTSLSIFAGSMEFVLVNLLLSGFDLLQAFLMTLMINARHLFYGISMLDRYRGLGLKKLYLIYGLTDETFSIVCAMEPPEGVDRGLFSLFVTLLDHSYWVLGCTLGGIFGSMLSFDTRGLEFVMTAMFAVIFLENWQKEKQHLPAIIGVVLPIVCLLIFGADSFMIPAMLSILAALTLLRKPLEQEVQP